MVTNMESRTELVLSFSYLSVNTFVLFKCMCISPLTSIAANQMVSDGDHDSPESTRPFSWTSSSLILQTSKSRWTPTFLCHFLNQHLHILYVMSFLYHNSSFYHVFFFLSCILTAMLNSYRLGNNKC